MGRFFFVCTCCFRNVGRAATASSFLLCRSDLGKNKQIASLIAAFFLAAPEKPHPTFLARGNPDSQITPPPVVHGLMGKPIRGQVRGGLGEGLSPSMGISKTTLCKRSVFSSQQEESHTVGSASSGTRHRNWHRDKTNKGCPSKAH